MKKALSFVLVLVMLVGLLPMNVLATETAEPDKVTTGIVLGDFAIAGVGTGALNTSATQLSQKTLIAVPCCGAELTITVQDGYQACVYSGNNSNRINQNSGWVGTDGDGKTMYTYTLPESSIYMRVSIRRTDGGAITQEDLMLSGLTVTYESTSDIVKDNSEVADILENTELPVLIHISDIHGDVIRAERAAYFAQQVGADALLASGDLTAYDPDDWGNALFDAVGNYPTVNFLYGVGNHDTKSISASAYQETIYNAYFKENPSTPNGETYYYRDLADQKLRIVAVNQQEGASTTTSGGTCYSQAQVDWLVEALKTTPAGYGVVFMYHSPETTIAAAEDPDYSEFFQVGNRYDKPTNSYSGYSGTLLMDLVDAFMLRENFTWNYSEKDGTSPVTLNADFTNVAEGVEFIAHVTGHVHSDSITYLPGTACKQLLLGVTCTNSMYGEPGGYYGLADYSDLNRVGNTSAQDAFNAYIIDRENKTVRVLRVGARQTVSGDIRDDMTIPYSVPFENGEYLFDTEGLIKLDLSNVEWVNYGFQVYGVEPTYYPGQRWSTDMIFDVPYDGVTFYIKINAPYELGIRSGKTDTTMSTNYYWLNNKELISGDKNRGYVYAIPAGHEKFILSIANVTRDGSNNVTNTNHPISFLELQAAGVEIWYRPEPTEEPNYPFSTEDKVKLDLNSVEWVNYGYQPYGPEPTYHVGTRLTTNMIFDVPYEGVTFYIKINAPYELGIRSGETGTAMDTNLGWLNNKYLSSGNSNYGYVYTIPAGHNKFILTIGNVTRNSSNNVSNDRNPITLEELEAAGLEIWYTPLVHTHTYISAITPPTCTEQGYTTYTCECGDSYVDDYVDATGHTYKNGICIGCGEKLSFEGKTISILGDSISTYAGISDDSTVNATLSGSTIYYGQGALGGYRHTWWQQIIDTLGMDLLVNNSWSGTCVLKTRGTVGAYIDRCVQLHNDRTGEQPDVIAVFLGTNDYSYYQSTLGTAEIDYAALITDRGDGTFDYAKPTTTCEAYAIMLHKMTQRYPDAEIYCLGMLSRRDPDHDGREVVPPPTSFNAELKAIVERFGGTYVDVESCIPATASEFDQYMIDRRVHPNAAGMDKITEAVVGTMLQRQVTLRNVSYDLHNVSCSKEPAAVIENERLELTLAATDKDLDLAVRITMGDEDITSQCYANGKVSISKITGDIVITAIVLHRPSDYQWQFDNGELVSAGTNANQLTKLAGSTQDNVFRETRYQLAVTAELIHTRPWVVEWAGEGKGGFMLSQTANSTGAPFFFRRSGNYLTAFGHYNNKRYDNYGLTLDAANINGAAKHVYRLENRIAQNGNNMVWLLVDGIEIGALNNYYIAGASQGSTADWISGKDFYINYIGSSSHPLTGYALEYLSITECAHIFSNGICTVCGEDTVVAELEGNTLTLSGELEEGTRIFAAGYGGDGRFSGVKEFVWRGESLSEELPAWETVKLFFTDEEGLPLRKSITLNRQTGSRSGSLFVCSKVGKEEDWRFPLLFSEQCNTIFSK